MKDEYNFYVENLNGKIIAGAFTLKGILAIIKNNSWTIKGDATLNYKGGFTYQAEV